MQGSSSALKEIKRYAAAIDAEHYRLACIKMDEDGGKKTFILDKKDGVTKDFTPNELTAKIPEMRRLQQRGENIYYTPLSEKNIIFSLMI